ncbi:MAG: zf-HC2 domain-containing protein, partial [Actinomycetota bacterium]|nr:zf-HC2 domain-containing protein [Actinomycetota bacterium]
MSGARDAGCNCEPEVIFELAERALEPGREREVRRHLDDCPGCQELYERELRLNACLGSLEFSRTDSRSVCEAVAMALPTRPIKARLVWALVAAGLLATALLALGMQGANPVALAVDA